MDQLDCGASGGFLCLSEPEQRFYSGLLGFCQADEDQDCAGPRKLSSTRVAELFKASGLSAESLHKVTDLCGAKRLGYFTPTQFYVALKLLAATQSGLPVRLETLTSNLPLPRFAGMKNEGEVRYSLGPVGAEAPLSSGSGPGSGSWTAADGGAIRLSTEATVEKKEPGSESCSPPHSPASYHSYALGKHRNGADAQTVPENKPLPRPLVQPEQHASPNHYSTKFTTEYPLIAQTCHQTSVHYCDEDPWRMTEEQLQYYANQFRSLQPDLGALILGAVAKNFFTKSKLPIPELSHIWDLSDVDRDGALTFSEFCTAFHLIVARKNGFALPETLPATLRPGFTLQQQQIQQQQYQQSDIPDTPEPLIVFEDTSPRAAAMDGTLTERIQSSLTSTQPGLKQEPRKPDAAAAAAAAAVVVVVPPQDLDLQTRTKTRPRSYSSTSIEDAMKKAEEPPTPPPRPQKTHSRASSLDLNKLFQQGAPGLKSAWLLPPALPPRPSASQVPLFLAASEKTSQTKVQQPNFADFSLLREEEEGGVKPEEQSPRSRFGTSTEDLSKSGKQDVVPVCPGSAPQKPIRRKYHPESQNTETAPPAVGAFPHTNKPAQKAVCRQKRQIQTAIRKNRENNAVLTRLNTELQQKLKVVHRERLTLESQLDLLRPMATT